MASFVWAAAVAGNWSVGANWQVAGVPQAAAPTAADIAQFGTGTGATNSNCTTAAGDVCRELAVNDAYTGTLALANSNTALAVGDASGGAVRLGTGMTITGGAQARINLVSTSTNGGAGWPITLSGKSPNAVFRANGAGGRWTLQDTFSAVGILVSNGTFDANNKNVTLTGANGSWSVTGGVLIFGTGTWTYQATATQTIGSFTGGTVTAGSETHTLTGTGNLVRTFAGGTGSFGTLRHDAASGTGALSVTGTPTFVALGNVAGRTITLPAAATTTVTGANGLGGIKGTLKSGTAASAATISLTSLFVSVMRAVTLQDLTVTPAGHAVALDASVSTSGNTGITFNQPFGWGVAA